MENKDSIILKSVFEIRDKYSDSESFLSSEKIKDLCKNVEGNFFKKKYNIWNFLNLSENYIHNFSNEDERVIFGLKSGFIFTDYGIYMLTGFDQTQYGSSLWYEKFTYKKKEIGIHNYVFKDKNLTSQKSYEHFYSKYNTTYWINNNANFRYNVQILKIKGSEIYLGDFQLPDDFKSENDFDEEFERGFIYYNQNKKIVVNDDELNLFNDLINMVNSKREKINISFNKELKSKINDQLREFDKSNNGKLDTIEVKDDFQKLLRKYESKIIEIDKIYIQHFVKVANYQKQKRKNLQSIFESIRETKNQNELSLQVELLKDQVHSYELLLFHSLNMIISLVKSDMITFYEIYESFDKLDIFNSNHENEVSKRLNNLEEGIYELINSTRQMEQNIISGLRDLSYVTQESFRELSLNVSKDLKSIDSRISINNLLTGINAYQTYKLRKGK